MRLWVRRKFAVMPSRTGWRMLAWFLTALLATIFVAAIVANLHLPHPEGREWISALSGWAGGIGAVLAAVLALPELRDQVAEAKRQTDFTVGDAMPEIEVGIDDWKLGNVSFRVVNWNRRMMRLHRFYAIGVDREIVTGSGHLMSHDASVRLAFEPKEALPLVFASGWRDRTKEPDDIRGHLWVHDPGIDRPGTAKILFTAEIGIAGTLQTITHLAIVETRRNPLHSGDS